MKRRNGWLVEMAALMAVLAACAGQRQETAPEVDPSWLARVPPAGMAPVEEARAARQTHEDEVARASVALKDAENQVDVAKNEERAAKAAVDAAEAQVDAAKSRGQYTEINEAKATLDRAKLARQVAEARKQRDEKAVELAKAKEELAKTQLDTATAKVSQAEYRALVASHDTRASKLDPASFERAIAVNVEREHKARSDVTKQQQGYQTASSKYDQLRNQLQASRPTPPAG